MAAPRLCGEAEQRTLRLDRLPERGTLVDSRHPAGESRPPAPVDADTHVAQVHELRRDADVGDRERVADEEGTVAELTLQGVEGRRRLVVDRLLDLDLVGRLVEEPRADELLEEDLRADDGDERAGTVLLEPEGAREGV